MESLAGTETVEVTGIVKATIMILVPEEQLFETVMILNLAGAALAAATV